MILFCIVILNEDNMDNRLNSVIKFDLHIHSFASKYKEADNIVDNSTIENLPILLEKLNNNKVALFSITDHNRFDADLYVEAKRLLRECSSTYPEVKNILSGVEFDVQLEENLDKCHIIAIFDTINDDDLYKIKNRIDARILLKNQFYTKEDFEKLLKEIELDTILIAQQRKGFGNHSGKDNSIGDAVDNIEEIIKVGYINALEYQKPKVEGILKYNLREINTVIPLFSGSDCHDWTCYPYHDSKNQNTAFRHSKAKILPTFKGLLMALSSPETRFNRREESEIPYIQSIKIQDTEVFLSNGINTIIGENGSGKSTLLDIINQMDSKTHVKKIKEQNHITVKGGTDLSRLKYIEQGFIVDKFRNPEKLFNQGEQSYFEEINNSEFIEIYQKYSSELKNCIKKNIKKNTCHNNLTKVLIYKDIPNVSNYFISIENDIQQMDNIHEQPFREIKSIIKEIEQVKQNRYYSNFQDNLSEILKRLLEIHTVIKHSYFKLHCDIEVKNIIQSCILNYQRTLREYLTTEDKEKSDYEQERNSFIYSIVQAVSDTSVVIDWPSSPQILIGQSSQPLQGFKFNKEAHYNKRQMLQEFLKNMFISRYQEISKIQEITSYENLQDAIYGCTNSTMIDSTWEKNTEKFIAMATKEEQYILDASDQQIGNTLGEMSLSYYKFFTQDDKDWNVLVIDQPEDNISNNNIRKELIKYFQDIREKKQIIFVTHNPLLVVNIDADNVIYIQNNKGSLNAINGCLEFEKDIDILSIVADNMDGGRETIEKRLRFYGKEH